MWAALGRLQGMHGFGLGPAVEPGGRDRRLLDSGLGAQQPWEPAESGGLRLGSGVVSVLGCQGRQDSGQHLSCSSSTAFWLPRAGNSAMSPTCFPWLQGQRKGTGQRLSPLAETLGCREGSDLGALGLEGVSEMLAAFPFPDPLPEAHRGGKELLFF